MYCEMFEAPNHKNMEWLPVIPQNIEFIKPKKQIMEQGDSIAEGWPLYDPSKQPYAKWTATQQKQMALGNYRMEIDLGDGVVLNLIKVPSGSFIMGSNRQPDEMPCTKINIEKPFWIGQFEVTNRQYRQFDPAHDSRDEHRHGYQFGRKGYSMNHDDQPVVRVSWQQAMDFCDWLSKKTGMQFTLPSEAQWEWACRAGSSTPFWFRRPEC